MSDKSKKQVRGAAKQNVIESLKDLGSATGNQVVDLFKDTSEDFIRELLGKRAVAKKASGEITPGESLNIKDALSGKDAENKKLRIQISNERQMRDDERKISERKLTELRVRLQALTVEVAKLAVSTQNLSEQAQIAIIQAPANPGIYHITFFEKLIEFLQSFRKKIDESATWLTSANSRSEKKNYWSMYKKKGSSFLLSPDHYLQRSAG